MPFVNESLTQIFPGLSVSSSGTLTIPSGAIRSFIPTAANTGVYDFIFGMIDTLAAAVNSGLPTNITVSEGSSLPSTTTLRKTYNFAVNLNFDSNAVEQILDVIKD
jgi:hypothetical protein